MSSRNKGKHVRAIWRLHVQFPAKAIYFLVSNIWILETFKVGELISWEFAIKRPPAQFLEKNIMFKNTNLLKIRKLDNDLCGRFVACKCCFSWILVNQISIPTDPPPLTPGHELKPCFPFYFLFPYNPNTSCGKTGGTKQQVFPSSSGFFFISGFVTVGC